MSAERECLVVLVEKARGKWNDGECAVTEARQRAHRLHEDFVDALERLRRYDRNHPEEAK